MYVTGEVPGTRDALVVLFAATTLPEIFSLDTSRGAGETPEAGC